MKVSKIIIAGLFLLSLYATADQFEGFYDTDLINSRVGLEYHNGEYGWRYYSTYWLGRVTSNYDSTPYNKWFQAGVHNTYEHTNDQEQQGVYGFLKNSSSLIELDIYKAGTQNYNVYHTSTDTDANCKAHLSGESVMQDGIKLSDCLKAIRDFHDDYPNHHVITLWMELKGSNIWDAANGDVLNDLLVEHLGDDFLIEQSEVQGEHSSLREAVNKKGWPTLGQLRGKILVVLFNYSTSNQLLDDYQNAVTTPARAFVAPHLTTPTVADVSTGNVDEPDAFTSDEDKGSVIFYSLDGDDYQDHSYGLEIFRNNRVSSTFYTDSENTPGVSEHRDFFIQHARWGRGRNEESLNEAYQYSGRLRPANGSYPIHPITRFRSVKDPAKCLAIENGSKSNRADVVVASCTDAEAQRFAVIDSAIDYDTATDFPTSRGYLIQALIGGNTGSPNTKVLEVRGNCCGNTGDGKEVFQYDRESTDTNNRPEDQYWTFEHQGTGVFQIKNINSGGYLDVGSSSAEQDKTPNNHYQWRLEPVFTE